MKAIQLLCVTRRSTRLIHCGCLIRPYRRNCSDAELTPSLVEIIRQTKECKKIGKERVILTSLSGHGHFDLTTYDAFLGDTPKVAHKSRTSTVVQTQSATVRRCNHSYASA